MVNIPNASSSLFIRTPSWAMGLCTLRLKWHNHKIQKSIPTVNSRRVVVSLLQYLQPSHVIGFWLLWWRKKQWTSFLGTRDEGMETFFIPTVRTRSIAPSLCVVQHIMGTWPNSLPSPEASASCVILFLSSLVSLSIFSLWAQGMALCFARSLVVYLASSSGTDCHGRLSQTHALSSPFYSIPSPQPASDCLLV